MANHQPQDWRQLLDQARSYEQAGDVYNAIKLYKRVAKLEPEQPEAYERMGGVYQQRREWKPAFHYHKKALSLSPANREVWWRLGIAATALNKLKLAGSVWSKFGPAPGGDGSPEGLRLAYDDSFEILWMRALDPARAQILSIPHPASGLRFREVVLYNRQPIGYHVVSNRRVPVYDELGSWKKSPFQTFSCLLHTAAPNHIQQLEDLCRKHGAGFELWSNASRSLVINHPRAFPEYYSREILPNQPQHTASCIVAIAALHQAEVQHILNAWQIISLAQYSDLVGY
jgi:tetratricopeptide (TPR) repeat protein